MDLSNTKALELEIIIEPTFILSSVINLKVAKTNTYF